MDFLMTENMLILLNAIVNALFLRQLLFLVTIIIER